MGNFIATHTPVIPEDDGTISHVYWDGNQLVDTKKLAWVRVGTPIVMPETPGFPSRVYPFSDANYYSLGSGASVLNFDGPFTFHIIFSYSGAVQEIPFSCSAANGSNGFCISLTGTTLNAIYQPSSYATTLPDTRTDPWICSTGITTASGIAGNMMFLLNGKLLKNFSGVTYTKNSNAPVYIGRYASTGLPFLHGVYEVMCSTRAPTVQGLQDLHNLVLPKIGYNA